ncbi:glutamate 5-kinase [Candidatus Desantisbacteria bacterium CG_4_9_14_3_um_filter_40_11]|uniref:Glutamate 5-kinase n=3 Tax=unclassified Candidatus Desantisiibacteriota TaxID=3106372 RepID=A0A2M7J9V1_9BACT|nr:MAG: glutamate 5-kinase [Candidatus Desantisbacteria bacterium CG_4_8_14_3_um_filter_40_12]PIY19465.1 MAG: glutamate 5-kinase [Candidatus Desantisbacteria bacterium CG_4_10_14_3_um_filter_40_18]PJB29550.1 MAG: glutamate 5-kinase [Candidatus Desantisbacteria bacterium CG_4_9_14_3_um_filter_40_11]
MTPSWNRIVVKIGTSLLTTPEGNFSPDCIAGIVKELCCLRQSGKEIILVTSGAIGAGMCKLDLKRRPATIPLKQACAAVGQNYLMNSYKHLFNEYEQTIAQILLTYQDLSNRKSYLNTYNTLLTLLQYTVIPIINENDTVAIEEIKFGDNDTLSSLVAQLVEADLLLLLTDIDGLYSRTSNGKGFGELIPVVEDITPEIINMAKGTNNKFTTGGMATKIKAAQMATQAGITVIILNGRKQGIISQILEGKECGTTFVAKKDGLSNRKRWIMYNLKTAGEIIIDDGAREAILNQGKSLLPSGVMNVKGRFEEGDAVVVMSIHGDTLARGLVNYSRGDLIKIKGKQSTQIEEILGYEYGEEIIHRDNLVMV